MKNAYVQKLAAQRTAREVQAHQDGAQFALNLCAVALNNITALAGSGWNAWNRRSTGCWRRSSATTWSWPPRAWPGESSR